MEKKFSFLSITFLCIKGWLTNVALPDNSWDSNPRSSVTGPALYQQSYEAKPEAGRRMIVFVFNISKLTSFLHLNTDYVCSASTIIPRSAPDLAL